MTDMKNLFGRLPKAFLGGLTGLVLGGIGGTIFAAMGYVPTVPWEEVFIFFGTIFGLIVGWKDE